MSTPDPVTNRLRMLRERAGLSRQKLAIAIGYKNASSVQRYEDASVFTQEHLPLPLVRQLLEILPGKGTPPISREEVLMLAGLTELNETATNQVDRLKGIDIIADIQQGVFRENFERPSSEFEFAVDTSGDTTNVPRYAARVHGDHFKQYSVDNGAVAFFYKIDDLGGLHLLQSGALVLVLQRNSGLVSSCIMEYVRTDGHKALLYPAGDGAEPVASLPGGGFPERLEVYGFIYHWTNPGKNRKPTPRN